MKKAAYIRHVLFFSLSLGILAFMAICIGRLSSNPVVFSIRIPRVLASMMIGAMLSLSGAVYQGVFRNPLVSPDILGVSAGASVGAAGAILLGLGMIQQQGFAFFGGILAVVMATTIPKLLRNNLNLTLVLSGIIVGGFLTSLLPS